MEDQQETENGTPDARSRRRLVGTVAGAVLVLGAAGGGIAVAATSSGATTGSRGGVAPSPGTSGRAGAPAGEGFPGGGMPGGGVPGDEVDWSGGPPGGAGGVKPTVAGTVTSVDAAGDSFVLKESSGTKVTVDVTSSTTYFDPGVSSPGLADVVTGKPVAVVGTKSAGTVNASRVLIGIAGGPGGQHGGGFGPNGAGDRPTGASGSWGPPAA